MALPTSGPISISQINAELGRSGNTPNTSLHALETNGYSIPIRYTASPKPNGSNPNSLSEWRGYIHANSNLFYLYEGASEGDPATCTSYSPYYVGAYSTDSYLDIGSYLYSDAGLQYAYYASTFYYADGNTLITLNTSGMIVGMYSCVTEEFFGFPISTGTSSNPNNVYIHTLNTMLYGETPHMLIGSTLYTNTELTDEAPGNPSVYRHFTNGDWGNTYIRISAAGVVLNIGEGM